MDGEDDVTDAIGRRIDSRREFDAALHEVAGLARQRHVHRMVWVDEDFADWPLDDPALLACLSDWLRQPQRRLVLLARDFGDLQRRAARFVAWYRLWTHAVGACSPAEDSTGTLPSVAWAEVASMAHLSDRERWRGWISSDAATLRRWRDRIDALVQRSEPSFPATTLGL